MRAAVDAAQQRDAEAGLLKRLAQALFREEADMRAVKNAGIPIMPVFFEQELEHVLVIAHVGDRADQHAAGRDVSLDVLQETNVVGHVLDHVVAYDDIEVSRRQLGLHLLEGAAEHACQARTGDVGGG